MKTIPQRELRNDNARVVEEVLTGESFVITRNGQPVAELGPVRSRRPVFVRREELIRLARANVRIDRHRYRADLDAVIDQELSHDDGEMTTGT